MAPALRWIRRPLAALWPISAAAVYTLASAQEPGPDSMTAGSPVVAEHPVAVAESGAKLPGIAELLLRNLSLGPVAWSGLLKTEIGYFTSPNSKSSSANVGLNLNGRSYLISPALLSFSGSLGIAETRVRESQGGASGGAVITGDFISSILPNSIFPAEVGFGRSSSQASSTLSTTDYLLTSANYLQRYQPREGGGSGQFSLAESRFEDDIGLLDHTQSAGVGGEVNTGEESRLTGDLGVSRSSQPRAAAQTERITGQAEYRFWTEYWFSNSYRVRLDDLYEQSRAPNGLAIENGYRNATASTDVMWIPSDDVPLTLTANALAVDLTTDADAATRSRLYSVLGSAAYRFTETLSGGFSASGSTAQTTAGSRTFSSEIGTLTYTPRPIGTDYLYTYSGNASLTNGDDNGLSRQAVALGFGQGVDRATGWQNYRINWGFGQGVGATWEKVELSQNPGWVLTQSLSNNARIRLSPATEGTGSWNLEGEAFDVRRKVGDIDDGSQYIRLAWGGAAGLSRRASLTGELRVVFDRQNIDSQGYGEWTRNLSGLLAYRYLRPFGWRNGVYTATFNANAVDLAARRSGDTTVNPYNYSYTLRQELSSRVALLTFRATMDMASDGRQRPSTAILFRVERQLGR